MSDNNNLRYNIIMYISTFSGMEYQKKVKILLKEYYLYKNLDFEMPSGAGGDDKNDGWVRSESIYYQIYAPVQYPNTFAKNLRDKFENDFEALAYIVFSKNKWSGKIEEFYFLCNTRNEGLPKDPNNFYIKIKENIENKYNVDIPIVKMVDNDYLLDLLWEIDDEIVVKKICGKLNACGMINFRETNFEDILKFIDKVGCNKDIKSLCEGSDYTRISTNEKICLNELGSLKNEINAMIPFLGAVDEAVEYCNNNMKFSQSFINTKNLVIDLYKKDSKKYKGADLFNKIVDDLLDFTTELKSFYIPAKMIVVYIFDNCDIFEKEAKELLKVEEK